jgi:hypothetical protein
MKRTNASVKPIRYMLRGSNETISTANDEEVGEEEQPHVLCQEGRTLHCGQPLIYK